MRKGAGRSRERNVFPPAALSDFTRDRECPGKNPQYIWELEENILKQSAG